MLWYINHPTKSLGMSLAEFQNELAKMLQIISITGTTQKC